jgi:DNA-binding XRE family transcriptional regulator
MYKRKPIPTTPLTCWLIAYVEEHETNLTELALKAGLSSGSLRSLVKYPERIPALETCLRLSKVTGKPGDEIFQMAGLDGYEPSEGMDPERLGLLRIYKSLPFPLRRTLVTIAQALETSLSLGE